MSSSLPSSFFLSLSLSLSLSLFFFLSVQFVLPKTYFQAGETKSGSRDEQRGKDGRFCFFSNFSFFFSPRDKKEGRRAGHVVDFTHLDAKFSAQESTKKWKNKKSLVWKRGERREGSLEARAQSSYIALISIINTMQSIAQVQNVQKINAVSTGKVANEKSMMVWRPHGNK
jgi:hypothetical protein